MLVKVLIDFLIVLAKIILTNYAKGYWPNTFFQVLQVSELLDVELNKRHIEKVYRMNAPTKSGHKTLVVQLSDKNVRQNFLKL